MRCTGGRGSIVLGLSIVLFLMMGSGCSWIGVKPVVAGQSPARCTESTTAPAVDSIMAGVGALSALASVPVFLVANSARNSLERGLVTILVAVPMLVGGLLVGSTYGFSARYGWNATRQCGALRRQQAAAVVVANTPAPGADVRVERGSTIPTRDPSLWAAPARGAVTLSPLRPGVVFDSPTGSQGSFALLTDIDYYLTPNITIGGLINIGFGPNINSAISSGFQGLTAGPHVKIVNDSPDHVPYLRLALPFRIGPGAYGGTSWYGIGLLQVGAGYRYYFSRRVGLGFDASVIPTYVFGAQYSSIFWGAQLSSGVELKF